MKHIIIFCFILVSFVNNQKVFSQFSKVPFTNRYRILLLNERDLIMESNLRYKLYIRTNMTLQSTHPDVVMIRNVGDKIVKATHKIFDDYGLASLLNGFSFEFNVVESKEVNAWCMPGGKIVVYTGILPFCKEEGYMAALLAHEIAHAIAQHGNERLSQQLALRGVKEILQGQFKSLVENYKEVFDVVYDVSTDVGLLAYSREHEYEADLIGMYIMAAAGYKPIYAQYFWQKMMDASASEPIEFLSTHPSNKNRIEQIKKNIPEAEKFYSKK